MSYHSRQASISSIISGSTHTHPQKIGPWKLGKTLGRGATGRVLLATHQTTGQKAAVKVVSKSELHDDDHKKSTDDAGLPYGIEREIIIMKLLTHPNVLRLYDVWETSKALYLVLEYVEGGELFDLLVERGPLQEIEAIKYFRQIILGTAYCHALGICHRDLKPENLLLDASLNVKLADFGMAALESGGKLLETSCGSPHYAAPEIVSGLKYHGAASDVWSCGVILFALLTGRLPFDDENIRNLLLKVQAGNFEMPNEISDDAKDLIDQMLTVDPSQRIPTEKILSHPLLNKYPIPNEDLISVKSLPHPETAYKSLGSAKNIDKQILSNLSILWHDRPQHDIVNCLLRNGPNAEKTFYALLMRYRHSQDVSNFHSPKKSHSFNTKKGMVRSGSASSKTTPRKKRTSQISASRPTSFQYKNGNRNSIINVGQGRMSASSSVQNSPRKSPMRSPHKSPRKFANYQDDSKTPAIPRNIYNEIVSAQQSGSLQSMPPSLPSKDSYLADRTHQYQNHPESQPNGYDEGEANPIVDEISSQNLMASANISLVRKNTANVSALDNIHNNSMPNNKRSSIVKRSNSKNRLSRRKSLRASMTTGLKRNSITMKLLSTYAKLAGETDWEYMDKQTKRTSATFASLCDKIFNQEQYDEDDENLVDEEEKNAREFERLMEIERKKHEAELKARKELEKKRTRQKRRSLMSSRKLSVLVKDDGGNNSEQDITVNGNEILQPKRQSKNPLRSISEGNKDKDDLTSEELENLKRRSVTQPVARRNHTPVLKRRPVSRLDPLWTAYENEELTRAKDALDSELKESRATQTRKKSNRESMVHYDQKSKRESVISVIEDRRYSRDSYYDRDSKYELPEPAVDDSDLSEEYMSEIRKSRLLNSQMNINGIITEQAPESPGPKTLISNVKIPNVTRKSRNFTNSNKRLSVLSMYSTKVSYKDLNSILGEDDDANMPGMRTSFADRLDRAGLAEDDEEEPLDKGSIMDFDEHLAKKRSSYYAAPSANKNRNSTQSTTKRYSRRPSSQLPSLPAEDDHQDADETFVTKNDVVVHNRGSHNYDGQRRKSGNNLDEGYTDDDSGVFDNIKLPDGKSSKSSIAPFVENGSKQQTNRPNKIKTNSMIPSAESMLIPDLKNIPNASGSTQPYPKVRKAKGDMDTIPPTPPPHQAKKPLGDTTNQPTIPQQKRNRSIFRKLSWGSKKALDEPNQQLPSPADSRETSREEKPKTSSFFRWFSSSNGNHNGVDSDIKRFHTILPKQEMSTALYALLNSWSNFGVNNLRNDQLSYNITGAISSNNSFNLKSCKFRIKINSREMNQKSEIVCARVKGSKATSETLFKEIEKVLRKEGVMDK